MLRRQKLITGEGHRHDARDRLSKSKTGYMWNSEFATNISSALSYMAKNTRQAAIARFGVRVDDCIV